MTTRATTVAHAAPRTPSAGAPRRPKISIQLTTTFNRFASDQRDHHRPHHAHALQVSPERRVQEQRRNAPREHVEIRMRQP